MICQIDDKTVTHYFLVLPSRKIAPKALTMTSPLKDKKILITAGPTREYLDPVRFITNESSGKMGYALAEYFDQRGASVILVSGPVTLETVFPSEKIISVVSGAAMLAACEPHFSSIDVAVFCAAVADYAPVQFSTQKIKKIETRCTLELRKNADIALAFAKVKQPGQIAIGFALETENILENGLKKMERKNFDFIVVNSPAPLEGFGYDTNKVSIITRKKAILEYPLKTKKAVAVDIVTLLEDYVEGT